MCFCLCLVEGNGTPLQYSCLENPMDGGAWKAAVHGVTKSRTQLSDFTFTFHFHALEKEMATHSSVLAWRIPGTGEPGGLTSLGRTESDTTEVTWQQWRPLARCAVRAPHCSGLSLLSRAVGACASVVTACRLSGTGSVLVVLGLRCSKACGTVMAQGSNLCLPHWQADSLPLSHWESP